MASATRLLEARGGQDARVLCPDLTLAALLKDNSKTFHFILSIYQAAASHSVPLESQPVLIPGVWWDQVNSLIVGSIAADGPEYRCLTLVRNELISASGFAIRCAAMLIQGSSNCCARHHQVIFDRFQSGRRSTGPEACKTDSRPR